MARTIWWNTSYPYRRKLQIIGPIGGIPAPHPVTITLSGDNTLAKGKVRQDLEDVEVLHLSSGATPVWTVCSASRTQFNGDIILTFNLVEDLDEGEVSSDSYYVYYGNPNLVNAPVRIIYTKDSWPLDILFSSNEVTYTRPGEHWIIDVDRAYSSFLLAQATFKFTGTAIRLDSYTAPNHGILELQIDDSEWLDVDLFSLDNDATPTVTAVYSKELNDGDHTLRTRATDRSNPSSQGSTVNVVKFEYFKFATVVDLGEELTDLNWSSSIGGV